MNMQESLYLESGCVCHTRAGGEPSWLFLHGNGCDSTDWRQVWDSLPTEWRLVALDFRGHGLSSIPQTPITLDDLAQDVGRLLGSLGGRWHVAGHSLGGMVAMQVAALFPRHVAGLVLIEGWTNLRCARQLSDNFYGGLGEQQRKAIRRKSKETFARWPAGLWEPYWDSVEAADASNFLSSTDLPIIEVYGDHGHPPLPREALGVPDHPHIEVRWVTGAGHYLPLEQPESVALACRDLCGG